MYLDDHCSIPVLILQQDLGCLLHNSNKKSINDIYTRFKYISKISKDNWELISNHYENDRILNKKNLLFNVNEMDKKHLIPKLCSVDFFLKVPKFKIIKHWVEKIRKTEGIQLAYEIDKKVLNDLENLIFD